MSVFFSFFRSIRNNIKKINLFTPPSNHHLIDENSNVFIDNLGNFIKIYF